MRISDWSSDVCSSDLLSRPVHPRICCGKDHEDRPGDIGRRAAVPPSHGAGEICGHAGSVIRGSRNSRRSEEHTSELQSLMRISYAVFCLKKKTHLTINQIL